MDNISLIGKTSAIYATGGTLYAERQTSGGFAQQSSLTIDKYTDIKTLVDMSINTDKNSDIFNSGLGSELYTLKNSKLTTDTASIFKRMLYECLAWLVDDKVVESIEIETETKGKDTINYSITIKSPRLQNNLIISEVWNNAN